MEGEIRVGDIGTVFEVTIRDGSSIVDISSATTKNIIFKRKDNTILTTVGVFATDGTDGKMKHTTVSGDLTVKGQYCIQGYVVLPTGSWHSDIEQFDVFANLGD